MPSTHAFNIQFNIPLVCHLTNQENTLNIYIYMCISTYLYHTFNISLVSFATPFEMFLKYMYIYIMAYIFSISFEISVIYHWCIAQIQPWPFSFKHTTYIGGLYLIAMLSILLCIIACFSIKWFTPLWRKLCPYLHQHVLKLLP